MDRVIFHCDLNCFYASVELLSHLELREVPVAVAGDPASRHGIILAKNEPAKQCGVKTAETIWQAKKKCPVLVLLPLLFVVGDFLPASGFARAVTLTGGVSIGLFLYALLFTAAADLLALLLRLTPLSRRPAFRSRKTLRAVGCAVLALSVCVSVYGVVNAATIDRTTYSVSFENGDDDGMRIALISDLHLGSEIGSAQMRRVVEEVNACEADIVVIAGDVFNAEVEDCCDLDETAAELRRIKSRLGVYAVLGNHDPSPEYPPLQAFFESAGIRLLNDETVAFSGFTLVGRAESAPIHGDVSEGRKSLDELLDGADRSNPVIVIDHRPAGVDEAVAFGADLIMCGHTHRGQIFPANLIAAWTHGAGRNYGHTVEGNTDVIVTSGVGYWGPPMRTASDAEVVLIQTDLQG